jgi:UDP-2,3-diacylglucosamine hydrolase
MILFVSDIHFGRTTPDQERLVESELVDCLRAHEGHVDALYLLGDVFDQYIEYRHLIPKGFLRFQALLASWTDRGIPVTYIVGNHDPWHLDYFQLELGVRVFFEDLNEPLYNTNVYMRHGDRINASSWIYNMLRPILRHRVPVFLYRALLPGDSGYRMARWYNRRFGHTQMDQQAIMQLRDYARQKVQETNADLVVMGHSHQAECTTWPYGTYLNPGPWYRDRTFGRLDAEGPALLKWHNRTIQRVDKTFLSSHEIQSLF